MLQEPFIMSLWMAYPTSASPYRETHLPELRTSPSAADVHHFVQRIIQAERFRAVARRTRCLFLPLLIMLGEQRKSNRSQF